MFAGKSIFHTLKLLLTCEHAGNEIPEQYRHLFEGGDNEINSHRGYDPGAFDLFGYLKPLADYSLAYKLSRLLVEPNRSLGHPQLFSEFTRGLEKGAKNDILERYYFPYRNSVESQLEQWSQKGENVLHLSVHSFTPVLNGEVRKTDIGLLFDPARSSEKDFCTKWKKQFQNLDKGTKVRFNYPYLGKADGFTTFLRKKFPENYSGIELEVNQKFASQNQMDSQLKTIIKESFFRVLI